MMFSSIKTGFFPRKYILNRIKAGYIFIFFLEYSILCGADWSVMMGEIQLETTDSWFGHITSITTIILTKIYCKAEAIAVPPPPPSRLDTTESNLQSVI